MVKLIFFIVIIVPLFPAKAVDFGKLGHTYPIAEPDFLTQIEETLRKNPHKLARLTTAFQKRVEKSANSPQPLPLRKAVKSRIRAFDPSFEVTQDLKDHQGRLFAQRGDRINPLKIKPLSKPLLFFDGRDEAQLKWALAQEETAALILTGGSPLKLSEQHHAKIGKRSFYFDQHGLICKRLGIEVVPSKVSQKGDLLQIEEVFLKENAQ